MVVAVARAVEAGARAVVCASTGNTAASAAAYAARAGLPAVVLHPAGATATAKRAQAALPARADRAARQLRRRAAHLPRARSTRPGFVLVNSLNPDRIEGQKRVVGELVEQLGAVPDVVALPFGGGGNVTAVAARLEEAGSTCGSSSARRPSAPTTWASAIRIAEPAHAEHVAELVAAGRVEVVTLSEEELAVPGTGWRSEEGVVLRTGFGSGPRGADAARAEQRRDRGLHRDGPRAEGHRRGRRAARAAPVVEAELDAVLEAIG